VFQTVCKIEVSDFKIVPDHGPLILVGNHVNFLEIPVVVPHLDPRDVIGLAKRETWKNPLFHFLFEHWHAIPIDRGVVDREAFNKCIEVLEQGKILALAPEGTRSYDGKLLQAKPGVVALALRSKAPLMPIGFYGHVPFWKNLKRLKRTPFRVNVGKPFCIDTHGEALSKDVRQVVVDEIMYKIAEQLPEEYWGYYKDVRSVQYRYLVEITT
jgi:1-acyl-sn-glycerol-3-phosphate acyltransferase